MKLLDCKIGIVFHIFFPTLCNLREEFVDDVSKLVINHILFNQICIFNIEYGVQSQIGIGRILFCECKGQNAP